MFSNKKNTLKSIATNNGDNKKRPIFQSLSFPEQSAVVDEKYCNDNTINVDVGLELTTKPICTHI